MWCKDDYFGSMAALTAAALLMNMSLSLQAAPGAAEPTAAAPAEQCRFLGLHRFDDFTHEAGEDGARILVSPVIPAPIPWDQLVVSWNADAPPHSWLTLEARAICTGRQTKYYTLALWSPDNNPDHPRQSVRRQKDGDGDVAVDTLKLRETATSVQLRWTLGGTGSEGGPKLRFVGLSFLDSKTRLSSQPSDREAWGKIIPTPELSQHSYAEGGGWCSPTSLAMVLSRWSGILHRPEMKLDVPEVAADINDPSFGTGNWVFNAAFAGSFPGMRAYVTRFRDLSEVETWIKAGIPVVMSARWDLLAPGRKDTGSGHLVVCIGFTEDGDVVINDPATNLQKGQHVRHIYARSDVVKAWGTSHNTVYLIYPESTTPPADVNGEWDTTDGVK